MKIIEEKYEVLYHKKVLEYTTNVQVKKLLEEIERFKGHRHLFEILFYVKNHTYDGLLRVILIKWMTSYNPLSMLKKELETVYEITKEENWKVLEYEINSIEKILFSLKEINAGEK